MKLRISIYRGARRLRVLGPASSLALARQALTRAPTGSLIEVLVDGRWEPYE